MANVKVLHAWRFRIRYLQSRGQFYTATTSLSESWYQWHRCPWEWWILRTCSTCMRRRKIIGFMKWNVQVYNIRSLFLHKLWLAKLGRTARGQWCQWRIDGSKCRGVDSNTQPIYLKRVHAIHVFKVKNWHETGLHSESLSCVAHCLKFSFSLLSAMGAELHGLGLCKYCFEIDNPTEVNKETDPEPKPICLPFRLTLR